MRTVIKQRIIKAAIVFSVLAIFAGIIIPHFMSAAAEHKKMRLEDPNSVVICNSCGNYIAKL